MCGRYSFTASREKIKEQFGIDPENPLELSFNIAPTHLAYVIANDHPRQLQQLTWGLVPYWSNDGKNTGKMINARAEGIAGKPSFRMPIRKRRCLVLADSFYEWRREGQEKIPYRIMSKKQGIILAMAGVWDIWTDGKEEVKSFAIITTDANEEVGELHQRMPVILSSSELQQEWLADSPLDEVLNLLRPLPDHSLKMYRISSKLNSPSNNSMELHQEVPETPRLF